MILVPRLWHPAPHNLKRTLDPGNSASPLLKQQDFHVAQHSSPQQRYIWYHIDKRYNLLGLGILEWV